MSNELMLVEVILLAAGDCACLFTLQDLIDKITILPGYEDYSSPGKMESVRTSVNLLVREGKWKKVGTTGGRRTVVYCTDNRIPELYSIPEEEIKVVTKLDSDLPLSKVMEILSEYISAQIGQEELLSRQVHSLQGALQDKTSEILLLKEEHKREMDLVRSRYQKITSKLKEFANEV
jgi:hypothetical protein